MPKFRAKNKEEDKEKTMTKKEEIKLTGYYAATYSTIYSNLIEKDKAYFYVSTGSLFYLISNLVTKVLSYEKIGSIPYHLIILLCFLNGLIVLVYMKIMSLNTYILTTDLKDQKSEEEKFSFEFKSKLILYLDKGMSILFSISVLLTILLGINLSIK